MKGIPHRLPGRLGMVNQNRAALSRLALWLSVLLMAPMVQGQSAAELPASLHEPFSQCVEATKNARLEEAEKCLTDVLSRGGKASFVYNNLGIVNQMQREHEQAIKQFQEAIRLQPSYFAPRIAMGASLIAVGRYAEAAQHLEKAVKMQPQDLLARQQLIRAYEQTGNYVGVVEQYRILRALKPDDLEYAYQLGKAYVKLSAWCHKEILNQDPNSARAFQSLAENNIALGHTDTAVRNYQRAIEAAPKLPENHLALASIYKDQGKFSEALREVDAELSIVPYSAAAIELKKKLETLGAANNPQQ